MTSAFDTALLSRIEDAGINASAPREQLWIDGWLVRFSPGKAKRARCIRGLARTLCAQMLRSAASEGARTAYLQVEASNAPARRVYHGLGFADAYAYHYRSPPVA